jgi:hypothetical protein
LIRRYRKRNYSFGLGGVCHQRTVSDYSPEHMRTLVIRNSPAGVLALFQCFVLNIFKRFDQIMIAPLSGCIAFGENPNILA